MSETKNEIVESIKFEIKITDEVKFSSSLDKLSSKVLDLTNNFSSLQKLLKGEIGIKDFIADVGNLGTKMTSLEKGVVGAISVFAEFTQVKEGIYGVANGTEDVVSALGDMVGGVAIASTALYATFGPAGLAVSVIAGVTGAIAGVSEAFKKVDAQKLGESIKNGLSKPGGVAISDLTAEVIGSIEKIGNSFSEISEKTKAFEAANTNIQNLVFEIEKIETSTEAGILSTEEAVSTLTDLYGQLADAIMVKLGAAGDVLLATFAEGGLVATAFDAAGKSAEEMRISTVQAMNAQEESIYDLVEELNGLKESDPTNPRIMEIYQEMAILSQGISEADEAMARLEVTANKGLDWKAYLNEDGVDITTLTSTLEEVITACGAVRESAENDLISTVTSAQSLGDAALVDSIKEGIPGALNYIDEQTSLQALSITDTMQTELIGGIDDVITDAVQRWNDMNCFEQAFTGFTSASEYAQNAVNEYKANYIDPISATIEEQYSNLGIAGAGWAAEAADSMINGLFTSIMEYSHPTDTIGCYVTKINEDYKAIIDSATEGIYAQMKERGNYSVVGYDEGIEESISESEKITGQWMEAVKSIVEKSLDSHSPSKVMEQYGLYATQGYNLGISGNTGTSVETMNLYMDSVLQPFTALRNRMYQFGSYSVSGFDNGIRDNSVGTISVSNEYLNKVVQIFSAMTGKMYSIGANAMQGLLNGMESMETSIYDKANEIANNVAKTISSALQIASPSKVMYELGVFTMEGFKGGMESTYDDTYKSLYEFSYNIAEPQALYPYYKMEHPLTNNTNSISQVMGRDKDVENLSVLLPYLAQIAQNTKESALKEFSLNIGDRDIAKATYRGQKSLGRRIMAEI